MEECLLLLYAGREFHLFPCSESLHTIIRDIITTIESSGSYWLCNKITADNPTEMTFIHEYKIITNNNGKRMCKISDFIDRAITIKKQKVTIGFYS